VSNLFKINDVTFDIGIVNITRKPTIDRTSLGTTLDGIKHYKTNGTYYDYEITINTRRMNVTDYDRLYEMLTAPVDYYNVTIPYGQTEKTFRAIVKPGNDSIIQNFSTLRKWGSLKIMIEALEPERVVVND